MSLFQSTVMPDLKEPSDTTGVRKMGLDLLAKINKVWDGVVSLTNSSGIYDTGSNANGSWIRWNNGRMECRFQDSVTQTTTGAIGSIFRCATVAYTFPQVFTSTPMVMPGCLPSAGRPWAVLVPGAPPTTTGVSLEILGYSNANTGQLNYIAYGNWK